MMTVISPNMSDEEIDAAVEAWLPDDLDFRVATKREREQWFALAVDFDITGTGATRAAAVRQMGDLLSAYLAAYLVDGASFDEAIRPVPASMRLRMRLESALAKTIRRLDGRLPLSREDNYLLPTSQLAAHAHC
jgi:hypothetical protein